MLSKAADISKRMSITPLLKSSDSIISFSILKIAVTVLYMFGAIGGLHWAEEIVDLRVLYKLNQSQRF